VEKWAMVSTKPMKKRGTSQTWNLNTTLEAQSLIYILFNYEEALGKAISFRKLVILFSLNTTSDVVLSIIASLGVFGNISRGKYLSLQSMVGCIKKTIFKCFMEYCNIVIIVIKYYKVGE